MLGSWVSPPSYSPGFGSASTNAACSAAAKKARAALPIWTELMTKALAGKSVCDFAQPPGIIVARIDPATGLLPAPGTDGVEEFFLDGTAPTEAATAPGEEGNPDQMLLEGHGDK